MGSLAKFKEDTKKKIMTKIRTARGAEKSVNPDQVAEQVVAEVAEEIQTRGLDEGKFLDQMLDYARWVQ
jgi:hypothetical protein